MNMKPVELAYDVIYPDGDTQRNLSPVILLHGLTDTKKTWKALAPKIARETGRIVYAYDARNHGNSEWSEDFDFDILANDLEMFMNKMNISKAVLIGHSMGGKTALTLALKEPQRVEKLIVEDMVVRNWNLKPGSVGIVAQFINFLRASLNSIPQGANLQEAQKAIADYMNQLMQSSYATKSTNGSAFDSSTIPLKQKENGDFEWQANLDVIENFLANLNNFQQTFSGIYMGDALFLYGTKSFFKVNRDELIPRLFPNSERVPIEGGAHMLHAEFPDEFLRHVVGFILSPEQLRSKY